jgi:hypothetical protein
MPQARRSGSSSGSRSSTARSTTKRSTRSAAPGKSGSGASRSGGASKASGGRSGGTTRSGSARSSSARSSSARSSSARSTGARAGTPDARLEAVAQRLRKLNERIIDAGREAGETTLTSYEKVLKAIASAIERVPGSSDVEWLSNLATTQAKFIRDMTDAWTTRARKAIK